MDNNNNDNGNEDRKPAARKNYPHARSPSNNQQQRQQQDSDDMVSSIQDSTVKERSFARIVARKSTQRGPPLHVQVQKQNQAEKVKPIEVGEAKATEVAKAKPREDNAVAVNNNRQQRVQQNHPGSEQAVSPSVTSAAPGSYPDQMNFPFPAAAATDAGASYSPQIQQLPPMQQLSSSLSQQQQPQPQPQQQLSSLSQQQQQQQVHPTMDDEHTEPFDRDNLHIPDNTTAFVAVADRDAGTVFNRQNWWMVDFMHEPPLQQGATRLMRHCLQTQSWDEPFARRVLKAYKQYLEMLWKSRDYASLQFRAPPLVLCMWKLHMIDVVNYCHDCITHVGQVVGPNLEDLNQKQRQNFTIEELGKDYDREIWDYDGPVGAEQQQRVESKNLYRNLEANRHLGQVEATASQSRRQQREQSVGVGSAQTNNSNAMDSEDEHGCNLGQPVADTKPRNHQYGPMTISICYEGDKSTRTYFKIRGNTKMAKVFANIPYGKYGIKRQEDIEFYIDKESGQRSPIQEHQFAKDLNLKDNDVINIVEVANLADEDEDEDAYDSDGHLMEKKDDNIDGEDDDDFNDDAITSNAPQAKKSPTRSEKKRHEEAGRSTGTSSDDELVIEKAKKSASRRHKQGSNEVHLSSTIEDGVVAGHAEKRHKKGNKKRAAETALSATSDANEMAADENGGTFEIPLDVDNQVTPRIPIGQAILMEGESKTCDHDYEVVHKYKVPLPKFGPKEASKDEETEVIVVSKPCEESPSQQVSSLHSSSIDNAHASSAKPIRGGTTVPSEDKKEDGRELAKSPKANTSGPAASLTSRSIDDSPTNPEEASNEEAGVLTVVEVDRMPKEKRRKVSSSKSGLRQANKDKEVEVREPPLGKRGKRRPVLNTEEEKLKELKKPPEDNSNIRASPAPPPIPKEKSEEEVNADNEVMETESRPKRNLHKLSSSARKALKEASKDEENEEIQVWEAATSSSISPSIPKKRRCRSEIEKLALGSLATSPRIPRKSKRKEADNLDDVNTAEASGGRRKHARAVAKESPFY